MNDEQEKSGFVEFWLGVIGTIVLIAMFGVVIFP